MAQTDYELKAGLDVHLQKQDDQKILQWEWLERLFQNVELKRICSSQIRKIFFGRRFLEGRKLNWI